MLGLAAAAAGLPAAAAGLLAAAAGADAGSCRRGGARPAAAAGGQECHSGNSAGRRPPSVTHNNVSVRSSDAVVRCPHPLHHVRRSEIVHARSGQLSSAAPRRLRAPDQRPDRLSPLAAGTARPATAGSGSRSREWVRVEELEAGSSLVGHADLQPAPPGRPRRPGPGRTRRVVPASIQIARSDAQRRRRTGAPSAPGPSPASAPRRSGRSTPVRGSNGSSTVPSSPAEKQAATPSSPMQASSASLGERGSGDGSRPTSARCRRRRRAGAAPTLANSGR